MKRGFGSYGGFNGIKSMNPKYGKHPYLAFVYLSQLVSRQIKTQKREAALRAASLFWVLCPNKTGDRYISIAKLNVISYTEF